MLHGNEVGMRLLYSLLPSSKDKRWREVLSAAGEMADCELAAVAGSGQKR